MNQKPGKAAGNFALFMTQNFLLFFALRTACSKTSLLIAAENDAESWHYWQVVKLMAYKGLLAKQFETQPSRTLGP